MKSIKTLISKSALKKVDKINSASDWSIRLREIIKNKPTSVYKQFIYQQWAMQFETNPPTDKHIHLLELKIGYHIAFEERKREGAISDFKFLQNYNAAMELNLQKFHPSLRTILEISIKYNQKEEIKMKNKKEIVKKAVITKEKNSSNKTPKKGETWAALFQENYSKKLTDTDLAKEMSKRMNDGISYTVEQVVKSRGFFNFGALSSKVEKPKVALKQFEENTTEPKVVKIKKKAV